MRDVGYSVEDVTSDGEGLCSWEALKSLTQEATCGYSQQSEQQVSPWKWILQVHLHCSHGLHPMPLRSTSLCMFGEQLLQNSSGHLSEGKLRTRLMRQTLVPGAAGRLWTTTAIHLPPFSFSTSRPSVTTYVGLCGSPGGMTQILTPEVPEYLSCCPSPNRVTIPISCLITLTTGARGYQEALRPVPWIQNTVLRIPIV